MTDHNPRADSSQPHLTVIVPVLNEQESIPVLLQRLSETLSPLDLSWDLLLVDDGSTDGTRPLLRELSNKQTHVGFILLSRNFGKEMAMSAGLRHATGDAVVIIDADLQDPPELIPEMVKHWRQGYDVVYGQRTARDGESWLKRITAAGFYRFMEKISPIRIPRDTGDFRLMSRQVVDALNELPESRRFMKGLFAWVGFNQYALPYHRDARVAGKTKFNYSKLWHFALDGITSFSSAPLRLATWIGLLTSFSAMIYALFVIVKTLLFGDPVPGYPSLMVVLLFLGGIQLLALGVIGEYLARLFDETKRRPLYLIQEQVDCAENEKRREEKQVE